MEFTTNSESVSFAPEIQAMLSAHGDSSRSRLDTAIVLQSVVRSQMREILSAAANVARTRVSNQIQLEDLLFTMRSDPIRVQRLIKYLSVKDVAAANSAKQGLEVATPANRVRRCREFLFTIDTEGGLLRKAADDELQDACRLERHKMLDRVARHMDVRQYTDFTRARQVTFINHKHRFSQKFYVWLTTDSTGRAILADDLVDMSIDPSGLEVFAYLANEMIGLIVDIALIIQRDESSVTDPVKRLINPYTYNPLVASKSEAANGEAANQVDNQPLEPHHIREALSRLLLRPRCGEWFTKTSNGFNFIAPQLF